jgi:hypothetical protein
MAKLISWSAAATTSEAPIKPAGTWVSAEEETARSLIALPFRTLTNKRRLQERSSVSIDREFHSHRMHG